MKMMLKDTKKVTQCLVGEWYMCFIQFQILTVLLLLCESLVMICKT
jgi:hypothetical protein